MKNIFEYAKRYASWGWSVLPIPRGKKHPAGLDWKEFEQRYPTEKELQKWFYGKTNEDIGIGLVTGKISDIIVIDEDSYKKQGIILDVGSPLKSKTGRGGIHHFFKYVEGIKNSSNRDIAVDIKSEGGFVVLPPTIHPDTQKEYEWITDEEIDLKTLPTLDKLSFSRFTKIDNDNYSSKLDILDHTNISQGERNDSLHRVSCSFLNKYNELEAWELTNQINRTYNPPLSLQEVKVIFNSAKSFISSNPSINSGNPYREMSFISAVNLESNLNKSGNEKSKSQINQDPYLPIKMSDLSADLGTINWIWEGFIAKGHVTLFSALWKVGKSTLVSHLLHALEKDSRFPEPFEKDNKEYKTQKTRILILSEESNSIWARRRDEMGLLCDCWLVCRPLKQRLNYKGWVELLERMGRFCKQNSIELLIIDTLSGFWNVDNENDAAQVGGALTALNHVLDDNTAILLIHHFRKSGGEEAVAARGSGALGSFVDIIIEFTRLQGNTDSKERILKMYSRFDETPQEMVIELKEGIYIAKGLKRDVLREKKLQEILIIMFNHPEGLTIPEIIDAFGEEKKTERTIRNYITELKNQNKVFIKGEKIVGKKKIPIWTTKVQESQVNLPVNEIITEEMFEEALEAKTQQLYE